MKKIIFNNNPRQMLWQVLAPDVGMRESRAWMRR